MTKEQEEAIKWVNERLIYISQNCDLDDTENKRAYDSLETVLSMLKEKDVEMEKKNKIIDEMAEQLSSICTGISTVREQFEKCYCEFIDSEEDCCWKTNTKCNDCIKQYFERKVEEEK